MQVRHMPRKILELPEKQDEVVSPIKSIVEPIEKNARKAAGMLFVFY